MGVGLIIKRKVEELIKIGPNIEIAVIGIRANEHISCPNCRVTQHVDRFVEAYAELSVKAPRNIKIIRGELKPYGTKT